LTPTEDAAEPPAEDAIIAEEFDAAVRNGGEVSPAAPALTEERVRALYSELIMAVASKFPGETRHETALRYIRQGERVESLPGANASTEEGR